mmetsp:Transcript_46341/g.116700  ORF Transcript_46341/g.116700 Transcript_46341/m.116700 type:complete len:249 (+) Transcript_46341:370-1116(+)
MHYQPGSCALLRRGSIAGLRTKSCDQRASRAKENQQDEHIVEENEHGADQERRAGRHLVVVERRTEGVLQQRIGTPHSTHVGMREWERVGPHVDAAVVRQTDFVVVVRACGRMIITGRIQIVRIAHLEQLTFRSITHQTNHRMEGATTEASIRLDKASNILEGTTLLLGIVRYVQYAKIREEAITTAAGHNVNILALRFLVVFVDHAAHEHSLSRNVTVVRASLNTRLHQCLAVAQEGSHCGKYHFGL